jgi:hypothetical protein
MSVETMSGMLDDGVIGGCRTGHTMVLLLTSAPEAHFSGAPF